MSTPEAPISVILDTDMGTDVDDCLALAFLLGSPEIQLEAITTVYGDVALRARICRKLLTLRGRDDVPVYEGIRDPLMKIEPIYWPGHEGEGLLEPDDDPPETTGEHAAAHAVDILVERVMGAPGEINVLAVGPLTNIAAAIVREPRFARSVAKLTIMGGHIRTHEPPGPLAEHNIKSDPEAAHIVLSSSAPIALVPLDVTLRATIDTAGVDRIRASGTAYHAAVADQVVRYPPFTKRGNRTFLHDPLAAATLLRPDLLTWHDLNVEAELNGRLTRAMTIATAPGEERLATARVALDLDSAACERFVIDRIAE
ncbi:MAG: nucleoside hydrolase [Chloroflexota bacterium]|nr:nucleoside hydrolase [Chloroflexota bacterium]